MSHPTRVVVFSAGPGAGGDGVAGELAAGLSRLGLDVVSQVLTGPGAAPWQSMTEAEVARVAGPGTALVLSAGVLSGQILGRLRARGAITAPVVAYLADAAVHPLAVAAGVDLYLAGHQVAATQARVLGAADVRVVAPPVDPSFAAGEAGSDAELPGGRLALVIPADVETAVRTSHDIAATGFATPVISCGGDELLRRRIARATSGVTLEGAGADLIRCCDVVVQNAGGQASLEALTAGVPVISYRCVPGPGRANAAALEHAGLVPWVRVPDDLGPALRRVVDLPVPRVETAGPDAAEVIAELAGRRFPATTKPLPVRRIRPRRVRPVAAEALAHTVI